MGRSEPSNHPAVIYNTLQSLLEAMECVEKQGEDDWAKKARRFWIKKWKRHIEKHGNVPYITKCGVCSGEHQRWEVKTGKWKPGRPSKIERDEMAGK